MYCVLSFKTREMRPSENFSFSIYPEKHVHQLLETRAMLEPSQEYVMFFYLEVGTGSGLCLDRRDRAMKRAQWEERKRPRMLTIYTNHPGGNIVHKHLSWWENDALQRTTNSAEQTTKSRKIASPQITAHILRSFPNRVAGIIEFSNRDFWFSHANGKNP